MCYTMFVNPITAKYRLLLTGCWRKHLFIGTLLISALMGLAESVMQHLDSRHVRSVAWTVVQRAHASDPRSRVIALRDYLRANVSFERAPRDNRPFLRASA